MSFETLGLSAEIVRAVEEQGYREPTPIQRQAIPVVLEGRDLMASAQTGTGKTAGFTLPLLQLLSKHDHPVKGRRPVRALILTPTRELAAQIGENVEAYSKHLRLRSLVVFGGVSINPQMMKLRGGVDILVATPGRLLDLEHQNAVDLSKIEILVLDEADRMLARGFLEDIQAIKKKLPRQHQTLFFSATIDKEIKKLAYSQVKTSAIRIQIAPDNPVSKNVSHWVVEMEMDDKRFFLRRFVRDHDTQRIMVFVRTRVRAERVTKALERGGISAVFIHGARDQAERDRIMARFKAGEERILIATDVSARGIDIPNLDYVINYDLPDNPENYVHRVGRTGRGTRKGQAFSFCSPGEKPLLHQIQALIHEEILIQPVSPEEYARILLDPKDTEGIRQMILIHEAEADKKVRKKAKKTKRSG